MSKKDKAAGLEQQGGQRPDFLPPEYWDDETDRPRLELLIQHMDEQALAIDTLDAQANTLREQVKTLEGDPDAQIVAQPKTLNEACNDFLNSVDYVLYTRGKRLGDLLSLRNNVSGFMSIEHPILKEPVSE